MGLGLSRHLIVISETVGCKINESITSRVMQWIISALDLIFLHTGSSHKMLLILRKV